MSGGVVVNMIAWDTGESEIKLHSSYYVLFQTNTHVKGRNSQISSAMGEIVSTISKWMLLLLF